MEQDRSDLEGLDREALIALALTQQAHLDALEMQRAALTARIDELRGEPPTPRSPRRDQRSSSPRARARRRSRAN